MELLDLLHQEGATICMVTHDPRSAERAVRNIDVLDGQVVADRLLSSVNDKETAA